MTRSLLAEFDDVAALRRAIDAMNRTGRRVIDAFTPFPVEGLAEAIGTVRSAIRPVMLAAGLGVAAFFYALQWYSAAVAFPFNSGNRPLHSWPVFLLAPFEIGVFGAALAGFIAFLVSCRLPRPHHPLFDIPPFERATRDHFFLLVATVDDARDIIDLRRHLEREGAVAVTEVRER